jgi:hypothetical protein
MKKYDAAPIDCESLVEFLCEIEGVEVAVLLRETNPAGSNAAESKYYADITGIAVAFGGGVP